MSSSERTCMTCGTVYYGEVWSLFGKCNVCRQTERLLAQAEDQAERANEAQANAQRFQAHQAYVAEANRQREIQRQQQEIQTQNEIDAENRSSDEYFRSQGRWSAENYNGLSPDEIHIFANTNGYLSWNASLRYFTNRANDLFLDGISEILTHTRASREILINSAYECGERNCNGELLPLFCLYTGIQINGIDIFTYNYDPNFKSFISDDGELFVGFDDPFDDADLNSAYRQGVREAEANANETWKMADRKSELRSTRAKGSIVPSFVYHLACNIGDRLKR